MGHGMLERDRDLYELWAECENDWQTQGYPSMHAMLVEQLFFPPESYDDTWAEKIMEVWRYVVSQPCTCTEPAVDQYDPCPRCRVLNRKFDEYDGRGR